MKKSEALFTSVVEQLRKTDAAQLSVEYASLRDDIVRERSVLFQRSMASSVVATPQAPWDQTLTSPGQFFEEAYLELHT
jgi:hypothetical protein